MMRARFTENATGIEVIAQTLYQWGEDGPAFVLVTFPEIGPGIPGMEYGLERKTFDRHFSMCPNQDIKARAFSGNPQTRPLVSQRELDDAALLQWARAVKMG
jgi:hypothetical protein